MKNQTFKNSFIGNHGLLKNKLNPKSFLLLLICTLLFTACNEKDPVPDTNPIARAGADQLVKVTETVTLDGTTSDSKNETVDFKWEMLRKPVNSSANLTGATTAKPTFTADASGEFEIQLTVSNASGSSSDKVLITASQLPPIVIDKDIITATILGDRILNPDFPDYIISTDIAVKSQLTLHPGVVIAFARDARFTISDNGGVLVAKGTAERKIRLIGLEKTKGFWSGVMINSPSTANILDYVEVLHAGSQTMLDNTKMALAMFIESQATIKNCIFSQNDGYGLFVQEGAVLREFSANSFTNNSSAGIKIPSENVSKLDVKSVFTGNNGRDVVEIIGSYLGSANAKEEIIWKGFLDKTPYRLLNSLSVRSGWKINPGVTIEISGDQRIIINEEAYLIAKGTAADNVKFTGATNSIASWEGILCHSKNQQNSVEFAEISNGGSGDVVAGEKANLALYGENAYMSIRNARITGSGGYGIYVGYNCKINEDFERNNVFSGNTYGDVKIDNPTFKDIVKRSSSAVSPIR